MIFFSFKLENNCFVRCQVLPRCTVVKNLPANTGDTRDLIPGLGRSPGGGHGNPLQNSCLENPKDRGGWWTTVHAVRESDTTEHAHT